MAGVPAPHRTESLTVRCYQHLRDRTMSVMEGKCKAVWGAASSDREHLSSVLEYGRRVWGKF